MSNIDSPVEFSLSQYATADAKKYGVPVNLFLAQINQESGWNPEAINGDAIGIAQFMPNTAQQFGINPNNPEESLDAAAKYDAELYAGTASGALTASQSQGSWLNTLRSYGTLNPTGTLSGTQLTLGTAAQKLDAQIAQAKGETQAKAIDQSIGGLPDLDNIGLSWMSHVGNWTIVAVGIFLFIGAIMVANRKYTPQIVKAVSA